MKILMINVVCGIKSTGRICTDLADVLTEQGHTVKIAYGREEAPDKYKKYAVKIGTDLDVKLHGVRSRLLDESGFGSKKATIRFIEWVKKYNPDVIHLHNIHGYYINIEVLFDYLRTCGKKIIWTLHDCWAFTGHCSHFSYVKCDRWKKGCNNCQQKREYPASCFLDNSSHNWSKKKKLFTGIENLTIITPSKWLSDLVKQSFLKKYPVKVINNGIDTTVFKPTPSQFREKHGLSEKKIILGVASAWGPRKGLNDFIKLASLLKSPYKLILVGLSEKQANSLPSNIMGITRTNSTAELAEIYTASDVFLNLTYEDNYPTVNLEAQACGTAVISYRTGGSPESIPSCNVVEIGAFELIAKKNITKDLKNLEILPVKSIEQMIKEYLEVYQQCFLKQLFQ